MNCPNCHTWNPDDKQVCWRCQTALPKPEAGRERKPFKLFGLPVWMVALILAFLLLPWLGQCFVGFPGP
ncbi:MAG: hypothetical protein HUU23_10665 [Caldilineales bacterium]|nr:hypothetical protein [Caldilineales bacterium]